MENRENHIINIYTKLVLELYKVAKDLKSVPQRLLPASKVEIKGILQYSKISNKDTFVKLLDHFDSELGTISDFLAQLTANPSILMLMYSVWILFHGASWLWVCLSIWGFVGVSSSLAMLLLYKFEKFRFFKRLLQSILFEFLRSTGFFAFAALWLRLVTYSGIYGIYKATSLKFEFWSLLFSLISLVIAYFYSKQLNSIYFFIFEHPTKARLTA